MKSNTETQISQAGTGYSSLIDSFMAGKEAAQIAMQAIEGKISFALLFCSAKHDPNEVLKGALSITGEIPLIGGAALGVFNNLHVSYEGYECAISVISSDDIHFETFLTENINHDEYSAGQHLANSIKDKLSDQAQGLMVFYETAKTENPPMLNFATPLFKAIDEILPRDLTIVGSGLLSNMQLSNGFQYYNNRVVHQSAVAVLISGNCVFKNTIIHGCKPASSYHTITKAEGPVIFEIDHKPALDVISELLSSQKDIEWKDFPLFITLGVNKGDKWGDFHETDYANRLCLAVDEVNKAMIMFEPDLKAGDDFQLMHRTVNIDTLRSGIDSLNDQSEKDENCMLYFYINCAGRAKPYSGADFEDAEEIKNLLGQDIPFMGFYSGVEIARMQGNLQALDWTGVLCMLSNK